MTVAIQVCLWRERYSAFASVRQLFQASNSGFLSIVVLSLTLLWPNHGGASEDDPPGQVALADEIGDSLAASWGFEPIEQLPLEASDTEIRVWRTGLETTGFILRKRLGRWSAYHVGPAAPRSITISRFGYAAAEVQPLCAIEDIVSALESEQLFRLEPAFWPKACTPDRHNPSLCLETIVVDGWSLRIQAKRGSATFIDQTYHNPDSENDRPAPQAAMVHATNILSILTQALTNRRTTHFLPYSKPVVLPGVILVRVKGQYVSAFQIDRLHIDGQQGRAVFSEHYFRELEQGFQGVPDLEVTDQVLSWRGGARRSIDPEGRFRIFTADGHTRVALTSRQPHDARAFELAVPGVQFVSALKFEHLASGFEAVPASRSDHQICKRARPLTNKTTHQKTRRIWKAIVTAAEDHMLLPPTLAAQKWVTADVVDSGYGTIFVGTPKSYTVNDTIWVERQVKAPESGTDKPQVSYRILEEPPLEY